MKTFLDNFAAILGAFSVALLLTSIVHEYGYFWMIGPNFQTLLTTSDYLANSVLWLPYVLFFALFNVQWKLDYEPPKERCGWKAWKEWRPWRTWKTWALPLLFVSSLVWIVVTARKNHQAVGVSGTESWLPDLMG